MSHILYLIYVFTRRLSAMNEVRMNGAASGETGGSKKSLKDEGDCDLCSERNMRKCTIRTKSELKHDSCAAEYTRGWLMFLSMCVGKL